MRKNLHKSILCIGLAVLMSAAFAPMPSTAIAASGDTALLAEQLDMPIVSIQSACSISSKETYVDATASIYDESGAAELTDAAISIRLRGNSTLNSPKKSYRMKFETKQNPLSIGDGAGKSWNLVSSCYDTSLLRHMTAYTLGDMLNAMPYTPNCRNVEVYLNGQYQGVYLLCEAVNANKNRINIAEAVDEVENQGYLVEMTRYAEEHYFDVGLQRFEIKNDLSADTAIAAKQTDYIHSYISQCYDAVTDGSLAAVEAVLDVDSLVDIYIGSEIAKNVDAGWDSFYMFKDAGGKLTFGPMWDFDLALGNFIDVKGFDSWKGLNVYDVANINANSNPWFCAVVKQAWFRERVVSRWNEKLAQLQTLDEFVTDEAAANARSYDRSCQKWGTLGKKVFSEPDEIAKLTTHTAHATYLADWVENRVDWLNTYFNSADFASGMLVDEDGKEISEDVNIAEYSTKFMMFASDYTIDDTPSCTVRFGANAWSNSFQFCMSGVMLEQGATYAVSFDCAATSSAKVSYKVQQNYGGYRAYQSETTNAGETVQHFETSFTSNVQDTNCAFIIEGSGSAGSEITVSNIVLKKQVKQPTGRGDYNADGMVNAADAAVLCDFLIGKPVTIAATDMNGDGVCNGFDLCILKQALLTK